MIENSGKYYLYRHIRIDNGQPFYIGIGSKIYKKEKKKYMKFMADKWKNKLTNKVFNAIKNYKL
jgi:hypothetical protein